MNKIYERYVPPSWHKIDYMTSLNARNNWIRAKYASGLFIIPPPPFVSSDSSYALVAPESADASFYVNPMNENPPSNNLQSTKVLPPRIVDYFITVGIFSRNILLLFRIEIVCDLLWILNFLRRCRHWKGNLKTCRVKFCQMHRGALQYRRDTVQPVGGGLFPDSELPRGHSHPRTRGAAGLSHGTDLISDREGAFFLLLRAHGRVASEALRHVAHHLRARRPLFLVDLCKTRCKKWRRSSQQISQTGYERWEWWRAQWGRFLGG